MKNIKTFTAMVMALAGGAASIAAAQVLTTGGTAGSSLNNGANIGAGNHTGASVDTNNPTSSDIRAKVGVQGTAQARDNLSNNPVPNTTTPAEMGPGNTGAGSVQGSTHTAAQVKGAARLADVLPKGSASYTYYPKAQVYYSPGTSTYYYSQRGQWYSGNAIPAGVNLGTGSTVKLNGKGTITTP
ncbi:MAG TPA: hypothetical protein VHP58_00880 [Alphaproteobacteria bacterium]|nr:hypothetical protein [Alphaproteobacteria bacterium]